MKRRKFIQAATAGLAATTIATPAIAQSDPEIRWRLTSSYPKSLDTLFGGAEVFAKAVAEATDDRFQIQVFASGEIVPGLQAADAVTSGSVEMCQTASYYYVGKDPTFTFGTALPFGLNQRMIDAWMFAGGGMDLMNDFYKKYNIYAIPCGNTGAQMGGWYRKEIKSTQDFKGLKMRIGGLAGRVLAKLGLVTQQLAGSDVYAALEKGTLDAAEWVGPYDDEKLRLYRVAPYYYYPGWWEGGAMLHNFINIGKWNALPKKYQSIVHSASHVANTIMMARYDAENPPALRRLIAAGAKIRSFPVPVLDASYNAANELYAEISAKNEGFKKVYDSLVAFRNDQYLWWQVAEYGFDSYMVRTRTRS